MDEQIKLEIKHIGPLAVVFLSATLPTDKAQALYDDLADLTKYGEVVAVNPQQEAADVV
jgi:hypothetical protein